MMKTRTSIFQHGVVWALALASGTGAVEGGSLTHLKLGWRRLPHRRRRG